MEGAWRTQIPPGPWSKTPLGESHLRDSPGTGISRVSDKQGHCGADMKTPKCREVRHTSATEKGCCMGLKDEACEMGK